MANEMTGRPDATGTHIWLRYTTQFTVGKRTHTVEVSIPVPIGASAETRERLIREAEVSMDQLASHVERRVEQMQRGLPAQPAASAAPQSRPAPAPANKPPVAPAPSPAREEIPPLADEQREVAVPPTRPNIGASMPVAPGLMTDMSGSMSLPQFIQYIKELGLDARRAMELLRVRSLQGLNYREALDQLQQMVVREQLPTDSMPAAQAARETGAAQIARPGAKAAPAPANTGSAQSRQASRPSPDSPPMPEPAGSDLPTPAGVIEIKNAVVREYPAAFGFDEEEDISLADDNDNYLSDLSEEERARAEDILTTLREARGSSQPNERRFTALRNVVNDQVTEDQLEELIAGVWGTTSLKKLKDEQLEALISWAKHADDFIADVDMVLTLLQEENYARSDR